ncbi:ribosome biogenesis protein SLX9-domain-containing protein [Aspergillus coremiiformis]|uniref:Ribosome biogenesis protein SLX9 n=1 Tax=Aspergillus coremiiformis TaxID=138285 RepID=A0A5N6ZIN7_9EURO|nr:ribosome biogenesis protein SLX9-domain-containing protein [Aspergillus coremiiformis]
MAPVKSVKKQSAVKMPAFGSGARPSSKPSLFDDDFRTTKKDKRLIKHATLISKIEKISKKTTKRRRASKKLVANLESLADALPETEVEMNDSNSQVNVIKQKTLKHKPGAMKRRQQLEQAERGRFAKNMAQMSSIEPSTATPNAELNNQASSVSNRWAALRNFISQTMEQQPVFKATK